MLNHYIVNTPATPEMLERLGFDRPQLVAHANYGLFTEAKGPYILAAMIAVLGIDPDTATSWEDLNRLQRSVVLRIAAEAALDVMPPLDPARLQRAFDEQRAGSWLINPESWSETIYRTLVNTPEPRHLAVHVDTSTPMPPAYWQNVWTSLREVGRQAKVHTFTLIECDVNIQGHDAWQYENIPETVSLKGKGGCSYAPAFELIAHYNPDVLVTVADLYADHRRLQEPPWPVFWVTPAEHSCPVKPHFGTVLEIPVPQD